MDEYKFERLTFSRIPDLHRIFRESGKKHTNLEEFILKYDTKYTGIEYVGYIAYHKDTLQPAAYYGVIPQLAFDGENTILIAQSADTITHPKHQRKGLFTVLAKMTYKLAKEEGIHFLFGIANENSFPGFIKKLNWTYHSNIKVYEIKSFMIPVSQLFRTNEVLKSIYKYWVRFILLFYKKESDISGFQYFFRDQYGIKYDGNYYKYKKYSDKYVLKICKHKIWLKFEGSLKIGSFEKLDTNAYNCFTRKLKILAFITGIKKIRYQESSNKRECDSYLKSFSFHEGLPLIFLNLSNKYHPEELVLTFADFDTF